MTTTPRERVAPHALVESRAATEAASQGLPLADGVSRTALDAGGAPASLFTPSAYSGIERPVVLYLHGGGFRQGSVQTYAPYTSHIAALTGYRVLSVDYRLAPEHPFPASLEDATAAYGWLIEHVGESTPVLLAGDSAGGGIAAGLLHEVRRRGLRAPAALALTSPWVDLRLQSSSAVEFADSDPVFPLANALEARRMYLDGTDPSDPAASPLLGDWDGMPPLFVAASNLETLRDDAASLAEIAKAAGVQVEHVRFPETAHGWWMAYPTTPESIDVMDRMCAFLTSIGERDEQWLDD